MTGIKIGRGKPVPSPSVDPSYDDLVEPGRVGGLVHVLQNRFLLRLLVRRELRARYKGSLLGLGWSYVRPAVNFTVYFFVIGTFLGMSGDIEDFGIYLFSGMVLISFFADTLQAATRSVTGNAPLIRKIFLPREMFPTASLLVSVVHFIPGMAILLVGAVASGWRPSLNGLAGAALGLAIIVLLAMGLGLVCSAVNVLFNDLQQMVDILVIVITWSVPMIYTWTHVRDNAPDWVLDLYLANPLVTSVSLFQRAFWAPGTSRAFEFPPDLLLRGWIFLGLSLLVVITGQRVFARLETRFAQEL